MSEETVDIFSGTINFGILPPTLFGTKTKKNKIKRVFFN